MKLAILAQAYLFDSSTPVNGTFVQLHNLSQGFSNVDIEVHYICTTRDLKKPNNEIENRVHFHWIYSEQGLLEWYTNMNKYRSILEAVQPDAIYVRGRNVLQYIAGKYAINHKVNFVWGTNGDDSAENWKNVKRLRYSNKSGYKKIILFPLKALEDSFINKGMKLPTSIVNQSEHQQRECKRLLNRDGIILPSYFLPLGQQVSKKNNILWLANLSPNKQPELFVKLIKESNLNGWNAILGGGTTDKPFEEQILNSLSNTAIETKGKINFADTFQYYSSAKIYVNTSKPDADGLPNAYLQSWLNGTVVLSLHHDPNGWMEKYNVGYCAKGDFEAFKNKLELLISDPEQLQKMSENAVKFAKETFASTTIIEQYIDLFKKDCTN